MGRAPVADARQKGHGAAFLGHPRAPEDRSDRLPLADPPVYRSRGGIPVRPDRACLRRRFSHDGELCSFDAFLKVYGIKDRALDALALIVRGADTARLELTPQSPGLLALSLGLSANFADDHAMLEHGMVMYDAFYAWCRSLQGETHNWTPPPSA